MKLRVSVTAWTSIVTWTVVIPSGTTPVGSASSTSRSILEEAPVTGIGAVSTRKSGASWSASPSTVTVGGSTVTVVTWNPGAAVPEIDRVDRERPALAVREDGDLDMHARRLEVDRTDRVAERIDRHDRELLVDVDAVRLDHDIDPGLDHPCHDRLRPGDLHLCRVAVASPSWRSAGGVPGTTRTGTVFVSSGSSWTATTAGS